MWRIGLLLVSMAACATAAKGDEGGGGGGGGKLDASVAMPDAPINVPDAAEMTDAPMGSACASAQTCAGAMMLGTVSGDSGNTKLTASGYQSAWYRVRVTENDSGPFGLTLRVGAKLTSPAGGMFDVFVYLNTGSDVVECSTTVGTATTAGSTKTIHAEWGEGSISNGSDDGRNASIEVRPVSGTCAPNQMWQLEIEGNWL
jgi:hypothetical protein